MTVREVIRMLERDGWVLARQRGSHRQFIHAVKRAGSPWPVTSETTCGLARSPPFSARPG